MIIFLHDDTEPWPAPTGILRAFVLPGVMRLVEENGTRVQYYSSANVREIEVTALLAAEAALPVDDSLTKAQLQDIAAQLGLSTTGLKAEILQRILDEIEP